MAEEALLCADSLEMNDVRPDMTLLEAAIHAQGEVFQQSLSDTHAHLFADAVLLVSKTQIDQMRAVISAVSEVVKLPAWDINSLQPASSGGAELGVFYGYDFHLNDEGAHLIEINSNAGGAFLNALLASSQRASVFPGAIAAEENLASVFVEMFRHEWHLARGDVPLNRIAIVDDQPVSQYLYPEFVLAKQLLEQAGIAVDIVDPAMLVEGVGGLYCDGQRIDLIYNRLTDFDLQQHPHIRLAWENKRVVLTPNPAHYQRYADKRKLTLLADCDWLSSAGVSQTSRQALAQGVPETRLVCEADAEQWWAERKQWFFKPVNGYGSKGAYRGDKVTKRVFETVMQSEYVAQRLALPGEHPVRMDGEAPKTLKYDVRCYVYDGQIQLIAGRLYQGQTTNFRTPGGGFALVAVVE